MLTLGGKLLDFAEKAASHRQELRASVVWGVSLWPPSS